MVKNQTHKKLELNWEIKTQKVTVKPKKLADKRLEMLERKKENLNKL